MSKQYDAYTFDSGGGFQSQSVCPDYLNCPICKSAGRCMKHNSQSKSFGETREPSFCTTCPVTGMTCYNISCLSECAFKDYPFRYVKGESKQHDKKDETIAHLAAAIDRLTKGEEHPKHQRVKQVLVTNFQNNKFIIMSLTIATNQSAPINLALVDADTLQPITATFTGETETSDNPAVATTDPSLGLVAVQTNTAGGSGNLTSVATWTYTDKNTLQPVTVTLTTVTPFTVTAVVTAERVQMVVTLGAAVTQPPVTTPGA